MTQFATPGTAGVAELGKHDQTVSSAGNLFV